MSLKVKKKFRSKFIGLLSSAKIDILIFKSHVVNIQSFIDDPDSLRRKRQKINNSQNALVLRHVQAEAEKREYFLSNCLQFYSFAGSGFK